MKQLTDSELQAEIELFESLVDVMPEPRQGLVKKMMEGPIGQAYFTAPASSKKEFHSCFPGGLLVHSINVTKNLRKLVKTLAPGKYDDATVAFVGLFHDLGKAGDGTNDYYIPEQSEWHREKLGKLYDINPACVYMPTSERGLFILQNQGIHLSSEEYLAIRLNDGMYDDTNKNYRMKEPQLALLLHWADMWSTLSEKSST